MILWSPDWPITAAIREYGLDPEAPIALVDRSLIFACSASARRDGVRRGQRVREAQTKHPQLVLVRYDVLIDNRAFEPVIAAIEHLMPGVQLLRPGTCAIRMRGPAAYYGGERPAALALIACLAELGIPGARVGIADGPFAAEQAARLLPRTSTAARTSILPLTSIASPPPALRDQVMVVAENASPAFLAPLPLSILGEPVLAVLLARLGIRTLGDFAQLQATDVRDRFGEKGAWAHTLASGLDERTVAARTPPPHLEQSVSFEPALDRVDQVAFGVLAIADDFITGLINRHLVCTAIHIDVEADRGELSARTWLHPRSFTAAEVVDRVRWQLQGSGEVDVGLGSGIVRVTITPESVDSVGNHEQGLWGTGPEERIHHGLSRVQSMLGHEAVVTASLSGGRTLAERHTFVAWGDRPASGSKREQPWPGQLPTPAPATVFPTPHPVHVFAAGGAAVTVNDRGEVSAPPASFAGSTGARARSIIAWTGPWAIDQRWWDADTALRANRFQLVDADSVAWLVVCITERTGGEHWVAEARYD
jgi:protein ImuB